MTQHPAFMRFFFGDPVRMASALVDATDLKPLTAKINEFLARKDAGRRGLSAI